MDSQSGLARLSFLVSSQYAIEQAGGLSVAFLTVFGAIGGGCTIGCIPSHGLGHDIAESKERVRGLSQVISLSCEATMSQYTNILSPL